MQPIRYRMTLAQRVGSVLPVVVVMGIATTVLALSGGLYPGDVRDTGTFAAALLVVASVPRRDGVALTPSAAIVYGWRRRTIAWSRIQSIQVESMFGERAVVLYEAGGRRTRLRAPSSTPLIAWDSKFEEKFHTIGQWWLGHRGADWAPVPPPKGWCEGASTWGGNPLAPPAE